MRIGNLAGRLVLIEDGRAVDVAEASGGEFGPDPQSAYERWEHFRMWADQPRQARTGREFEPRDLGPAVPRPPQVFAIGLNYADHAGESGFAVPENPVVFTKYVSAFAGADVEIALAGDRVDWEAELVVVIGRGGRDIPEADAWSSVAGLSVGQDISDRTVQFWGDPPQFSLGKSRKDFSPVGPWVVTVDEVSASHDVSALDIRCTLVQDGIDRELQHGSTRDMIFGVPQLITRLSAVVELLPGDVIFTGTPQGVGIGRRPPEFLRAGQVLRTEIEGIGSIRQTFV